MAASSAVPEYRLRLPYVPRAILKPYHAQLPAAGIDVELAEAVEQVAAALLAEVGAHGDVAAAQADPAQRYLTSFAWRFNRRYQLGTLTERLAYACARTAPHPYRIIIAG